MGALKVSESERYKYYKNWRRRGDREERERAR